MCAKQVAGFVKTFLQHPPIVSRAYFLLLRLSSFLLTVIWTPVFHYVPFQIELQNVGIQQAESCPKSSASCYLNLFLCAESSQVG